MRRACRISSVCLLAAALAWVAGVRVAAHKPITSKYTYNEHVFPILRDRCAACHVDGGIAPMSLMTYRDAYPWAESIRSELVAGHMPPWTIDTGNEPFKGARALTPHELDVIVTWATGGTPEGPLALKPAPVALRQEWSLGEPQFTVTVPETVTIPASEREITREFVIDDDALYDRPIRAIDVLPQTGAVVRRVVFSARTRNADARRANVVAIWLPGGDVVPAPEGTAMIVPRDRVLVARITYRKTWKYENTAVADRSRIGIYFGSSSAVRPIDEWRISGPTVLDRSVDVVGVRLEAAEPDREVQITASAPGGTKVSLVHGLTAPEWPRRYWFEHPVRLSSGTRIELSDPSAGIAAVLAVVPAGARHVNH